MTKPFKLPLYQPSRGEYISDATPALLIVVLLFMIPAEPRNWAKSPPLLEWQTIQEKFPWNIFMLVGGGFVLAKGTQVIEKHSHRNSQSQLQLQASGLSDWFSQQLLRMHVLPPMVLMLILCLIALFITEITSNTATATVLLPSIISMVFQVSFGLQYYAIFSPFLSGGNTWLSAIVLCNSGHSVLQFRVRSADRIGNQCDRFWGWGNEDHRHGKFWVVVDTLRRIIVFDFRSFRDFLWNWHA